METNSEMNEVLALPNGSIGGEWRFEIAHVVGEEKDREVVGARGEKSSWG